MLATDSVCCNSSLYFSVSVTSRTVLIIYMLPSLAFCNLFVVNRSIRWPSLLIALCSRLETWPCSVFTWACFTSDILSRAISLNHDLPAISLAAYPKSLPKPALAFIILPAVSIMPIPISAVSNTEVSKSSRNFSSARAFIISVISSILKDILWTRLPSIIWVKLLRYVFVSPCLSTSMRSAKTGFPFSASLKSATKTANSLRVISFSKLSPTSMPRPEIVLKVIAACPLNAIIL